MEDEDDPFDPNHIPLPPSAAPSAAGSRSNSGSPSGNLAAVDEQGADVISDQAAADEPSTEVDRAARVQARNSGDLAVIPPIEEQYSTPAGDRISSEQITDAPRDGGGSSRAESIDADAASAGGELDSGEIDEEAWRLRVQELELAILAQHHQLAERDNRIAEQENRIAQQEDQIALLCMEKGAVETDNAQLVEQVTFLAGDNEKLRGQLLVAETERDLLKADLDEDTFRRTAASPAKTHASTIAGDDRASFMGRIELDTKADAFIARMNDQPANSANDALFREHTAMIKAAHALLRGSQDGVLSVFPEKPLEVSKLQQAKTALEKFVKNNPLDQSVLVFDGGVKELYELMRRAFRDAALFHLERVFGAHTKLSDVVETYNKLWSAEMERRGSRSQKDGQDYLRVIFAQDQQIVYHLVGLFASPLSKVIADEFGAKGSVRGVTASRDLEEAGWYMLAVAERELVTPDPSNIISRVYHLLCLSKQFESRFKSNLRWYLEGISEELADFIKDYGPITPSMIRDVLVLAVLFRGTHKSLKAFRSYKEMRQEWRELWFRKPYSEIKGGLMNLLGEAIEYQRTNYEMLYRDKSLTRLEAGSLAPKPDEMMFFSQEEKDAECSLCGKRHNATQGCLTHENLKRLHDQLEPLMVKLTGTVTQIRTAAKLAGAQQQAGMAAAMDTLDHVVRMVNNSLHPSKRRGAPANRGRNKNPQKVNTATAVPPLQLPPPPSASPAASAPSLPATPSTTSTSASAGSVLSATPDNIRDIVAHAIHNILHNPGGAQSSTSNSANPATAAKAIAARLHQVGLPPDTCLSWATAGKCGLNAPCRQKYQHTPEAKGKLAVVGAAGPAMPSAARGVPTAQPKGTSVCKRKGCTQMCALRDDGTEHPFCSRTCARAAGKMAPQANQVTDLTPHTAGGSSFQISGDLCYGMVVA